MTPQEHSLLGSTVCDRHYKKPYTPLAITDSTMNAKECNKTRLEEKSFEGTLHTTYWETEEYLGGKATLEPLNLDKTSEHYGETIQDPILLEVKILLGDTKKEDFPYQRNVPIMRLEK